MNVSDSIQNRSALYGYTQSQQTARTEAKSANKSNGVESPNKTRLEALKAQVQSGQPVDLNALADNMLKKGAVIDIKA